MATIYLIPQHKQADLYMLWSKEQKKPISPVLEKNAFTKWYQLEYGKHSLDNLKERMTRVQQHGHSAIRTIENDLHTITKNNHAGESGKHLVLSSIITSYSLQQFSQRNILFPPQPMVMKQYVTWVINQKLKPIQFMCAIEDYQNYLETQQVLY